MIIDTVYAAIGKSSLAKTVAKYKDKYSDASPEEAYQLRKKELDDLHEQLYGDESSLGGETHNASGSAIIMPANYSKGVH